MQFSSFHNSKDYFQQHSTSAGKSYGKYFGYISISPLINHLTDKHFNSITYWKGINDTPYSRRILNEFLDTDDLLVLKKNIIHGNYIFEFILQHFRKKVLPILVGNEGLYIELLNNFNFLHLKNVSPKYGYEYLIYDLTGLALLNSLDSYDKKHLTDIMEGFINNKIQCPICGNFFRVIFFPEWFFKRVNGYAHLCYECPSIYPVKANMASIIKEMVDFLGFIPNSGFHLFNNNSFSSRVSREKWTETFSFILRLGGNLSGKDYIKKHYGSWFKALVKAGVLENNQLRTGRGIKCIGKSGNNVKQVQ
jgi:hypothetical protein